MIAYDQYANDLAAIRKSVQSAGEALHIDLMREQIDELTEEMNQPEFWSDTERANHINQKLGRLKNRLGHYEKLLSTADDIEVMMELAQDEGISAERRQRRSRPLPTRASGSKRSSLWSSSSLCSSSPILHGSSHCFSNTSSSTYSCSKCFTSRCNSS